MPRTDISGWKLEDYKMGGLHNWSSLVLPQVMRGGEVIGYVFVIDRKFGERAKYKMPAGHNQDNETPHETAFRETLGETGLTVSNLLYVDQWREGSANTGHWKFLFTAEITEARSMALNDRNEENEGEEPEFFTVAEFQTLVREQKFLDNHYRELTHYKLVEPVPELTKV